MSGQSVHQQEEISNQQTYSLRKSKGENEMKTIDEAVLAGYNAGIEKERLKSGIGLLEFERTKEILLEKLPAPPAVIYDIGGAYGEYSWWLTSLGYEVHLFDLSETNIKLSYDLKEEYPGFELKAAKVADAREIPRKDKSADVVLLMGPLYSITEYEERIAAIRESFRLLKDDGCYINPDKSRATGIGSSHLHTAKALREELKTGGFETGTVHGIMGGAWLPANLDELLSNEETKETLMKTVRMLDGHEEIIGLSGHLLAVSKKKL